MAMVVKKDAFSLPFFFIFFMVLSLNLGGILKLVNGDQKTWCVAKPSSSEAELLNNIHYVCVQEKFDCTIINEGCPCHEPNKHINHASVVMNMYYQAHGRNTWNCDFTRSALTVTTDPSYGGCKYA